MKRVAISAILTVLVLMSGSVFGADILAPGDFIIAIDADSASSSPDNETVDHAIDGVIQKYLNFGEENSGFIVTPAFGSSVVDSFQITTANDAEERDPTSWELYGTNDQIVSADHSNGNAESWTLVDSGSISLPVGRDTPGPVVAVNNSNSYRSYKMIFPTVKDAVAANSMQIAEVQFFGVGKTARGPDPDNGEAVAPKVQESNSNLFMILSFTAGDGAITHTAYFGTDAADVLSRNPANSLQAPPWPGPLPTTYYVGYDAPEVPEFARASLVGGVTYYWAVDEYDGAKTWPGDLWSFTVMPKETWGPNPAEGETVNGAAGANLSWQVGDVPADKSISYAVYYGTDSSAVETSTTPNATVTFRTHLTGSLEGGTAYYWRVDTVLTPQAPPFDIVTIPGNIWSFNTLPSVPITDPTLVGWYKLDAEYPGIVFDYSGHSNHGTEFGNTQWVDGAPGFGKAVSLDGTMGTYIRVPNDSSLNMTTAITVAAWVNPNTWSGGNRRILQKGDTDNQYRFWYENGENELRFDCTGVGTVQADVPPPPTGEWHHVAATYDGATMRIYTDARIINEGPFTGTIGTSTDPLNIGTKTPTSVATDHFDGLLDEVRLFNAALSPRDMKLLAGLVKATNPSPSDYATDVARTPTLSWEPGAFVGAFNGHNVYFSNDIDQIANRTAFMGTVTDPYYTITAALDLGKTYYWVVDEVNEPNMWSGDVWSFTTLGYLVVDDMETYTVWNVPDNNIFEVWVDGVGDCVSTGNDSGATVDVEFTTIIDVKSMKYEYDNDGMVFNPCTLMEETRPLLYSYIEAQVVGLPSGIGSDWTIDGVKALSLMFYGTIGNSIEPMWVKLTDTSNNSATVPYGVNPGESATDLEDMSWHEWNIDLADFTGVNLAAIKAMAIGVGNEDSVIPGGSGLLYFDQIRLYTPRCILDRRSTEFALLDYAPESTGGDCVVDNLELEVMMRDWLSMDLSADPVTPNPAGLVARYQFDGDATDSSGNGNNGTEYGLPIYITSMPDYGMAISLDGIDDYVDCGNNPSLDIAQAVTICAWLNLAATDTDQKIACNEDGATGGYKIGVFSNNKVEFEIRNSANAATLNRDVLGGAVLSTGEWYHVAGVYSQDEGSMKTYVDGSLDREMATTAVLGSSSGTLKIGREGFDEIHYFNGALDDVCIYNYTLSQGEILRVAGMGTVYEPVNSPANVVDPELMLQRAVNFKDYAFLLDNWLDEGLFP